jgi:SAM-dependent methyltransferase
VSFSDRFTTRAEAYAAARPSYPPAALAALFAGLGDAGALTVADLGAGTGISSRLLAAAGARVFAVEPNAAMRRAAQPDPRIEWIDGTAEHTTLAPASVDLVTAFQAWHWFEPEAATAEARRIVRPGGRLAIVYNERDERDAGTAAYGDIVRRYATDGTEGRRAGAVAHGQGIEPSRTDRVESLNIQRLDREGLHARARSTSYLPQSGATAEALHAELDALFERFAAGGRMELHLSTLTLRVAL